MRRKTIARIALVTACILLLPGLAMLTTDQLVWSLADFVVAGALLFGAGLTYELIASRTGDTAYRVAIGLAVGAALVLVWANLAVGLTGSGNNLADLMYAGVLAVGVVGAIIARLRPHGMSRALFATAVAQALVPVLALTIWEPRAGSAEAVPDLVPVLGMNGFFVLLFVGSALLFRRVGAAGLERRQRFE